jgi:hypothetical protein
MIPAEERDIDVSIPSHDGSLGLFEKDAGSGARRSNIGSPPCRTVNAGETKARPQV